MERPHVERGQHDPFGQQRVVRLGGAQPQLGPQRVVHVGHCAQRDAVGRGKRAHVVVESGNEDLSVHVAQRGNEVRQHRGRIRRPVAVVAAVQRTRRAVRRDHDIRHAAHAEHHLLAPALVHRSVGEHPAIAREQCGVPFEQGASMPIARFLFAVEVELEVHARLAPRCTQRIERREHGDDRRLVVAGRARVQAPFGSGGVVRRREWNDRSATVERSVAQCRLPRRRGPARRLYRLAIVVRVQDDRARCARRAELAVDRGRAARG